MTPPAQQIAEADAWQALAGLEDRPAFREACLGIAQRLRDGWAAPAPDLPAEPDTRVELALRLEPLLAKKAKLEQQRKPESVPKTSAEQKTERETRTKLAKIAGVSHDTIAKGKLAAIEASQRATARLLGVAQATVTRDLEPIGSVGTKKANKTTPEAKRSEPVGSVAWFQGSDGADVAKAGMHKERHLFAKMRAEVESASAQAA